MTGVQTCALPIYWPQLLGAIDATGATHVLVTHGFTGPVVRWLRDRGLQADALATRYEGERDDPGDAAPSDVAPESPTARP